MAEKLYDIIVIGGGPAGLTAGLYAKRAQMETLLIEKGMPGGQVLLTEFVDNYPGFPEGVTGRELMELMKAQVARMGLQIARDEITAISEEKDKKFGRIFRLASSDGRAYTALSLVIATGATWRQLGVPGEEEFRGKGVSYCAVCDAPFFKNKKIVVVGGGDTAVEESVYLTKFAPEVTIIHRRGRFRAAKALQDSLRQNRKIKTCMESVVTAIEGDKTVRKVRVKNVTDQSEKDIECSGIFIFVGIDPNSELVRDKVKSDERGFLITDNDMKTSADGIYACGDVRKKTSQQIIVAAGEGAQAALSAQKYAETLKGTAY